MPIVRRSTPVTVSQACRVPAVSASGKPEAKPKGSMIPVRRFIRIGSDGGELTGSHRMGW